MGTEALKLYGLAICESFVIVVLFLFQKLI